MMILTAVSPRRFSPVFVTEPGGTGPAPMIPTNVAFSAGGAGAVNGSWAAPTQKVDESSLPSGDISYYSVRRYNTSGTLLATTNVGNVLSANLTGIAAGTYDFTVAVTSLYTESDESFKYRVIVS